MINERTVAWSEFEAMAEAVGEERARADHLIVSLLALANAMQWRADDGIDTVSTAFIARELYALTQKEGR